MNKVLTCSVMGAKESYDIEIIHDALRNQAEYLSTLALRFAIIADDTVAELYGKPLINAFSNSGLEIHLFTFSAGEQYKTRETKELLENQLFEKGLGRDTCIIALGGGVTTDLAGYLAATYCRGLPLVMIPTSLLGMVDASIGGKTGVNVPYGKNLLGCIYQPKKVIIDTSTLQSLPQNELSNGVVEMIKHGLIADKNLFEYLESHCHLLLGLDSEALEKSIFESCRIKKEIVEEDEKENGKRRLLNFGHTIGHALERLSQYSLAHGEAVAIGILVESHLAMQLGFLSMDDLARIKKIFMDYKLPLQFPSQFSIESILEAMALDKKSLRGLPRFVIIDAIGSCQSYGSNFCTHVEEALIRNALSEYKG